MSTLPLEDLLNLMWSSLKIGRGSELYYRTLEEQLAKRVRGIRDEQFEQLIGCFADEDTAELSSEKFSQNFLKLVLRVIDEKKHRFNVRTMVSVIWACARIDFQNKMPELEQMLRAFAHYDRLAAALPTMYQKSQAILLWTYTRDTRLIKGENSCVHFVEKLLDAMLRYES